MTRTRDGIVNEIPASLVDHLESYLLNYFKPATYEQTNTTRQGRRLLEQIGCANCHIPDLLIKREWPTWRPFYDPAYGIFNNLFATARALLIKNDGHGFANPRTNDFVFLPQVRFLQQYLLSADAMNTGPS